MENTLYPIRFRPIYKKLIWGGEKLREEYGKTGAPEMTGESWEISNVEDNISIASNGFLAGNSLEELIEIYMGDIMGDRIFEKFGTFFPILTKFIHSNDNLSIQVHPGDDYAMEHHGENGKTEMWYILEAEKDARLIVGFNRDIDENEFLASLNSGTLVDLMNFEPVQKGDVLFIPTGRVHALGPGIVLAEIQQTSNMTYRIYDWERKDADGNARELHIDHALNVMDYVHRENYKTDYTPLMNSSVSLADCPYFTTRYMQFDQPVDKDYNLIDSFIIYMCMEGEVDIHYPGRTPETIRKGDSILIPAVLKEISLIPQKTSTLLEIYMI
ncbi:MAG: class I mannose-6-phosphate isomerase [Bacteroidales bacterium]|nr:class I mannose-6-phosphate isomerase [Bacteroidales bacterium]